LEKREEEATEENRERNESIEMICTSAGILWYEGDCTVRPRG